MHSLTFEQWQSMAHEIQLDTRPIVGGVGFNPNTNERFQSLNPHNNTPVFEYYACGEKDVVRVADAARKAFDDGRWSRLTPMTRKAMLLKFADLLEQHIEELALLDCLEMGKPVTNALAFDLPMGVANLRYFAEAIDKFYGAVAPSCSDSLTFQRYHPCGVIAAITPWNFPVTNVLIKLAPALAAGNVCVFKPSEVAPGSALRLVQLAAEAGIPEGVLSVITGQGDTGRLLAEHPNIDLITFTGSTNTGKALLQSAGAANLKRTLLECGGKSPQIVFADIKELNLQKIAEKLVMDAMFNQGQLCVAKTRLLIQRELYQPLLGLVVEHASTLVPGNPLDPAVAFGPLANAQQQQVVNDYITLGKKEGARPLVGDTRIPEQGCYVAPTVFADVNPECRLAQEEIFGPVLSVIPFTTPEQALTIANGSRYGLSANVWTTNLGVGHQFSQYLNCGDIAIYGSEEEVEGAPLANSGEPMKDSGFGAETGVAALKSYSLSKSISFSFAESGVLP